MDWLLLVFGIGHVDLEVGREILIVVRVEFVREVDSSDSAVGVDLDSQCFDVVGSVGSSGEISQVELDLVPAVVESHGHCANEWLDSCYALLARIPKGYKRNESGPMGTWVT